MASFAFFTARRLELRKLVLRRGVVRSYRFLFVVVGVFATKEVSQIVKMIARDFIVFVKYIDIKIVTGYIRVS
jgi:hypothetical protein